LERNYLPSERKNIIDFDLKDKNLKGYLDLSDFVNLESLNCAYNRLTKIKLSGCPKLKFVYCHSNALSDLSLINCPEIVEFCCADNYLNRLDFLKNLNSKRLELLNISNNNFQADYLFSFSSFTNLRLLCLGNNNEKKLKNDVLNRFVGSLKPLNNLVKLKYLDISNLSIDSDLEYLPNDIESLICSDTKHNRYREKAQEIVEKLKKFDDESKRKDFFFFYGDNFTTNLKV